MLVILLLTLLFSFGPAGSMVSGEQINDNMQSFSYAIKAARCRAGNETILFEHRTGPGLITEQWYTGSDCFDSRTIVRYYIDGESKPSIEANLFMMHGMGFYNGTLPAWGTKWIGHTARDGGLYNTFRIPFQKSIRVSFIPQTSNYYWYIIRGVENFPLIVGDLRLPFGARLVLHKLENQVYPPLVYVPLVITDKRGIVFSLSFRAESESQMYLEGCFGAVTTSADESTKVNMLSSGTEDLFLSAYYFNKLFYQTDDSGLTYKSAEGFKISAYKFFHQDPVIMEGLFSLLWRVSENNGGCWLSKEDASKANQSDNNPKAVPNNPHHRDENRYAPVKMTSYVWTYEW